jgi:FKBP-type peptidyl-prolyl cis-trans isomerase FklB
MKKTCYLCCALLLGITPVSHAQNKALDNPQQKYSYALALDYMKKLQRDNLTLDNAAFLKGLQDVQTGSKPLLSPAESRKALDYLIAERVRLHHEQSETNLEAGRTFLLANKFRAGVKELPSGLQYKVLETGSSQRSPKPGDGISVRYRMSDIDGKELLNSSPTGKPRKMLMDGMISAWKEVVPMMQEGAKWQLFVPAELAFGEPGSADGRIKTNQTLVYDLELVAIVPAEDAHAEMDKPEIIGDKPAGMK